MFNLNPLLVPRFHEDKFHEDKIFYNGTNYSPPRLESRTGLGRGSAIPLLGGVIRGGFLGREISVNPVRKFGRGFKPLPNCIFSNSALSDGDSFLTG